MAEKKTTSGHRIRLLRSRCLKTLLMHQSIPPAPSPPSLPELLRSICPPCHSRGWGICKFCTTRGPGVCQPWGHFWAFDTNAVSYQNRTTQKVLLEKTQIGSSVKDRNKLKRVVKACSRLCMHFFIALSQDYIAKLELSMWINVFWLLNQISVDIIWRTSFHIYKTIHNIQLNSALLILMAIVLH